MATPATKVDLKQLAIVRPSEGTDTPKTDPRPRHILTRVVLPAALLVGFAALVSYAAVERFSPPRPVTVVPVISSQSELDQPPDTPLFRAAGWVEPRPTPSLVTALSEGVVERLLVAEGQMVKEGDVVARLVSADARIALEVAEAEVALREGELASANATVLAAKARLEEPTHLKGELADAEAALAKVELEWASLPFRLKAAQARHQFAKVDWETKQKNLGVLPETIIAKAKGDLDAALADVEEIQSRQTRLPVEAAALKAKRDAVQLRLKLKVDETRQVSEAEALVRITEARLKQAKSGRDTSRLRLDRMEVKATASGRVLALVARPGMRLNGLNPGSLHDSSTVVTLYDPKSIQVRVDVRLDDVGKVQTGQKVRIETAAAPGRTLEGDVIVVTSQADIQKNTLSIKVGVIDPPTTLRPDMLCQVTFLSPPVTPNPSKEKNEKYRLLVPRSLIEASAEGSRVWVADRVTGKARLQSVQLGQSAGDLVEVVSGLSTSDKLIVGGKDGLRDGDRVTIAAEDESLGITSGMRSKNK